VKWAHNPQGAKPAILNAPNVPVEKALEPIEERGPKLHAHGEAGFR
jgi:trehalose utilization protein